MAACDSRAKEGEQCAKPEDCAQGLTCHEFKCVTPETLMASASPSSKPASLPTSSASASPQLAKSSSNKLLQYAAPAPAASVLTPQEVADVKAGMRFSELDMRLVPAGHRKLKNDCFEVTIPAGFTFDLETSKTMFINGAKGVAVFKDPQGALFSVACYGPNAFSVSELFTIQLGIHENERKANVTYKVKKNSWFVISGYVLGGEGIIYTRGTKVGPAYIEAQMLWSTALRELYDPRIGKVTKSVRPGKGILRLARGGE